MLPHLVEECTKYLWSDLYPRNACRAYEFAKLFEEPVLMDKCLHVSSHNLFSAVSSSTLIYFVVDHVSSNTRGTFRKQF